MPIALVAALAAVPLVRESRAARQHRYDIPGAVTVTGGLVALVYGFTKAAHARLAAGTTVVTVIAWCWPPSLLTAFVVIEIAHASNPLLPMRVVLDRNRGGSFLACS